MKLLAIICWLRYILEACSNHTSSFRELFSAFHFSTLVLPVSADPISPTIITASPHIQFDRNHSNRETAVLIHYEYRADLQYQAPTKTDWRLLQPCSQTRLHQWLGNWVISKYLHHSEHPSDSPSLFRTYAHHRSGLSLGSVDLSELRPSIQPALATSFAILVHH